MWSPIFGPKPNDATTTWNIEKDTPVKLQSGRMFEDFLI